MYTLVYCRSGQALNLVAEKLDEETLLRAVELTVESIGNTFVVDYTACENVHFEMINSGKHQHIHQHVNWTHYTHMH